MERICAAYGVPARQGMRVRVDGRDGVITGFAKDGCAHLSVRFDGDKRSLCAHPTWRVTYILPDGSEVEAK